MGVQWIDLQWTDDFVILFSSENKRLCEIFCVTSTPSLSILLDENGLISFQEGVPLRKVRGLLTFCILRILFKMHRTLQLHTHNSS